MCFGARLLVLCDVQHPTLTSLLDYSPSRKGRSAPTSKIMSLIETEDDDLDDEEYIPPPPLRSAAPSAGGGVEEERGAVAAAVTAGSPPRAATNGKSGTTTAAVAVEGLPHVTQQQQPDSRAAWNRGWSAEHEQHYYTDTGTGSSQWTAPTTGIISCR